MATEALSEDPTTNLALALEKVVRTTAGPAAKQMTGAADANYFNVRNQAAVRALVDTVAAAPSNSDGKVQAAQKALDASAGDEAKETDDVAGIVPKQVEVSASAPNVLGSGSRTQLAKATQALAVLAILASVVVFFVDESTDRVALLFVVLSIVCVVVAYLTTMGFGTVNMRIGPKDTTDDSTAS